MYKLIFFIGIIIVASYSACGYMSSSRNYKITCNYIKGTRSIDRFSIAELEVLSMNSRNTMPSNYNETQRVTCRIIKKIGENKKLFFKKKNKGYKWKYSTLTNYLNTDSLQSLDIKDKLEYLKKLKVIGSETTSFDTIPITFKPNTWYHIFGLDNVEGSYFMYFNEGKKCTVKYFNGGPF